MAVAGQTNGGGDARTDTQLLEAVRAGDVGAANALFERYEAQIYRVGLRMCRDPEDAKDILQETFLAAARNLRDFRGEAAVGTWLFTIARSFCIKQRRRHGRSIAADAKDSDEEAETIADPAVLPDEAAAGREVGEALQRAIAGLARPYRDVLVLRDVEGLTAPEVAAALGIGVDAVKSRLHRARVAVRDKVAPLLDGDEEPASLGCPDVLTLYSQKLEDEVDAAFCQKLEEHLAGCKRCVAACDSLRRSLVLCRTAGAQGAPVPPRVQASVRRAVQKILEQRPEQL